MGAIHIYRPLLDAIIGVRVSKLESWVYTSCNCKIAYISCCFAVCPHVGNALVNGICVVNDRQGSKIFPHVLPILRDRLSLTLFPAYSHIKTKSPVRQLKGWVDCRIWARVLRDGIHWWAQIIHSSSGIIPRE